MKTQFFKVKIKNAKIEFAAKRAKSLSKEQLINLPSPDRTNKTFYDWYINYLNSSTSPDCESEKIRMKIK